MSDFHPDRVIVVSRDYHESRYSADCVNSLRPSSCPEGGRQCTDRTISSLHRTLRLPHRRLPPSRKTHQLSDPPPTLVQANHHGRMTSAPLNGQKPDLPHRGRRLCRIAVWFSGHGRLKHLEHPFSKHQSHTTHTFHTTEYNAERCCCLSYHRRLRIMLRKR